jgi:hypothetical protein
MDINAAASWVAVLQWVGGLAFGCVSLVAGLIWKKLSSIRHERDELKAQLDAIRQAPTQPHGASYLLDKDGQRVCIHCYHAKQNQWRLLFAPSGWHCPVCGKPAE